MFSEWTFLLYRFWCLQSTKVLVNRTKCVTAKKKNTRTAFISCTKYWRIPITPYHDEVTSHELHYRSTFLTRNIVYWSRDEFHIATVTNNARLRFKLKKKILDLESSFFFSTKRFRKRLLINLFRVAWAPLKERGARNTRMDPTRIRRKLYGVRWRSRASRFGTIARVFWTTVDVVDWTRFMREPVCGQIADWQSRGVRRRSLQCLTIVDCRLLGGPRREIARNSFLEKEVHSERVETVVGPRQPLVPEQTFTWTRGSFSIHSARITREFRAKPRKTACRSFADIFGVRIHISVFRAFPRGSRRTCGGKIPGPFVAHTL